MPEREAWLYRNKSVLKLVRTGGVEAAVAGGGYGNPNAAFRQAST